MVRPHNPSNVRCGSTHEVYDDNECGPMLDMIPADVAPPRRWGPRNDPDVDGSNSGSSSAAPQHNCRLYVLGTEAERPARDEMSFYAMWEAAAIIKGMCVRYGKPGIIKGLGEFERAYKAHPMSLALPNELFVLAYRCGITLAGLRKLLWIAIDDGRKPPNLNAEDGAAAPNVTVLTLGGISSDGWEGSTT
ncbi:MAG: hypothetical protein Q9216_001588 [Gyalolechia sp. 2 TL-2023]